MWNGQVTEYFIPSTDTNAYAIGDPVTLLSGGADANGIPGCVLATAGGANAVLGAIVSAGSRLYAGAMADPNALGSAIIPATKTAGYYVLVADDPDIIFEIAEVATGTPLTAAAVGKNASLLAGTNNGYVSTWTLNNVGVATTATLQLKILRLKQTADNAIGLGAKWLVTINNHVFNGGVAGI